MEKWKRLIKAFSLVELMISLITIATITAAFAPVISKKLKSSAILARQEQIKVDCNSKFSDDCIFCDNTRCFICTKECASNEYLDSFNCVCKACTSNDPNCTVSCKFNKKMDGGSICTKCSPGYYIGDDGMCKECDQGYKCSNGISETPCNPNNGEYQDQKGQTSCKSCRLNVAGSTNNCNRCTDSKTGTCKSCNAGYGYSNKSCHLCDAGTYQSDDDTQNACMGCNPGHYCEEGSTSATQHECDNHTFCQAGHCAECANSTTRTGCKIYSKTEDRCVTCEGGYKISGVGCAVCGVGFYSSEEGNSATACSACIAGTNYCDNDTCTSCSEITSRSNCATYHTTQDACETCNSGYHIDGAGCSEDCRVANCASCSSGNAYSCASCNRGWYGSSCSSCPGYCETWTFWSRQGCGGARATYVSSDCGGASCHWGSWQWVCGYGGWPCYNAGGLYCWTGYAGA